MREVHIEFFGSIHACHHGMSGKRKEKKKGIGTLSNPRGGCLEARGGEETGSDESDSSPTILTIKPTRHDESTIQKHDVMMGQPGSAQKRYS